MDRWRKRVGLAAALLAVLVAWPWCPAAARAGDCVPVSGQAQAQDPSELNEPPPGPSIFANLPAELAADADVSRLTSLLEGSWKSVPAQAEGGQGDGPHGEGAEPMGLASAAGAGGDDGSDRRAVWLHLLAVRTDQLGPVVYLEMHRDGTPWLPIRQAMLRVYRYRDELRVRVYEFRDPDRPKVLANLWLAPEHFPAEHIRAQELIPTMDLRMDRATGGYEGGTAYAVPTMRESAVEMDVRLGVRPNRLELVETFFGLDGRPMPGVGGAVVFERARLPASVRVDADGLVVITLEEGKPDAQPTTEGDVLFLNYEGYLADGTKFESTWDNGLALRTVYPPRMIAGLKRGMEPWVEGMRRKLIIPPALGFGESETKNVPAGSTLVFHGHLLRVEHAEAMSAEDRRRRHERP